MKQEDFDRMGIEPFDDVVISGTASSPWGFVADKMAAVVSTVSEDAIKVWPKDEDGKIWFMTEDVTAIEKALPKEAT